MVSLKRLVKTVSVCMVLLCVISSVAFADEQPYGPGMGIVIGQEQAAAGEANTEAETLGFDPNTYGPGMPMVNNGTGAAAAQTGNSNIVMSNGREIDLTKPMIALTYDDGPQTTSGNRILDVFAKYGQRATFFLVGDRIASRADEVRRMVAEGHEIANHTYSHKYLTKYGAETIRSEVSKCNEAIKAITGSYPSVMRLPGGSKNSTVVANIGMPIILWNIDTRDWEHRNAQKTVSAILGKVKDGDIVLMHELYGATADATEIVVPELINQGFQLVTISEMAQFKGIQLGANQIYYSLR
ncbi:MAG: polysaccharide deacetylase family protein [Eubacteriales bacterium]|nr:polysaccharide deacetylase family protein [Eubacteriales bacterium]